MAVGQRAARQWHKSPHSDMFTVLSSPRGRGTHPAAVQVPTRHTPTNGHPRQNVKETEGEKKGVGGRRHGDERRVNLRPGGTESAAR